MTLLWIDSFDGYTGSNATAGYDLGATGTVTLTGGRGGGGAIEVSGTGLRKRIPSVTELIVGYAGFFTGAPGVSLTFDNGGTTWLTVSETDLNGAEGIQGNGNVLFNEYAGMRILNTWRYYEHKLKIGGGTSGIYELRIDEVPVITLTGINTQVNGATPAVTNRIQFGGQLGSFIDDLYISDTTTGPNAPTYPDNDFQGDLRMFNIHPNAPVLSGWTPNGAASNWDCVNDLQSDSAATNVETGVVSTKDIYDYEDPNLPPGTNIVAVATMTLAARLNTSGPRQLTTYIRGGVGTATATTEVSNALHQLSDTYYMEQFLRAQNPATGARWTAAEVDKIRAGFALTE